MIELKRLDNGNLQITLTDKNELIDMKGKVPEIHMLSHILEQSRYLGNGWDAPNGMGLTDDGNVIAYDAIYLDKEREEADAPETYVEVWHYRDYMISNFTDELLENGSVEFTLHQSLSDEEVNWIQTDKALYLLEVLVGEHSDDEIEHYDYYDTSDCGAYATWLNIETGERIYYLNRSLEHDNFMEVTFKQDEIFDDYGYKTWFENNVREIELSDFVENLIDGSQGTGIIPLFVEMFSDGEHLKILNNKDLTEHWKVLKDPEHDDFQECWGEVLDNVRVMLLGEEYTIEHSGDGDLVALNVDTPEWLMKEWNESK